MAKTRQAALIWSQEDQQYLWRDEHDTETLDVRQEPQAWQRRLAASTSFSFQGREGHLSLLKEARPHGGDGYWYAYQRQGKRTAKKYVGRTADLSAARLEQMARVLRCSPEQTHQDTADGDDGEQQIWPGSITTAYRLHERLPCLSPRSNCPRCILRLSRASGDSLCLIARWSTGSRWSLRRQGTAKPRWCANG